MLEKTGAQNIAAWENQGKQHKLIDHGESIKMLTVCSCHVTYVFQSESTLCICLHVKELLARHKIWRLSDCNWTRTQNHLFRKWTLNHLTKLTKGWVFIYELSGSGFESSCSQLKYCFWKKNNWEWCKKYKRLARIQVLTKDFTFNKIRYKYLRKSK